MNFQFRDSLAEMDSRTRFRGNDGLLQGLCPGFHRPRSAS